MIQIDAEMPNNCYDCWIRQNMGCRFANDSGWLNDRRDDSCPLKAQEPRLVTEADFENADEYGFIPVWCEERDKNRYLDHWECIPRTALKITKEDGCRYWTAKPSSKQMEGTPWK